MKIRTKILLLSSIFLAIMVATITSFVTYTIYNDAEKEINNYREREILLVKEKLKQNLSIVYDLVDAEYKAAQDSEVIQKRYGKRIKNVIEIATTILENYQNRVIDGELSLIEAQELAKKDIALLRYDGGTGYVMIVDDELPIPNMIMHPTAPKLNGKRLENKLWNTSKGVKKNLFTSAVELTKKQKHGFMSYEWPRPTGDGSLTEMQPKLSYMSLFKPWGWVIGTGMYVDDAKNDGVERIKDIVNKIRYDNGEGYFFITTNELPYPTSVVNPINPMGVGEVLDDLKWSKLALNNTEHLFTAIVKVTNNSTRAGYVDYPYKKLKGDKLLPKLSYTHAYEPLNWVIGTGIYIDQIDKDVAVKQAATRKKVEKLIKRIIAISGVVVVFSLLASFFFARGISKGLEELTKVARDISTGRGLNKKIQSTARKDEIGQLARAVERLQTSVKMMMSRMEKKK